MLQACERQAVCAKAHRPDRKNSLVSGERCRASRRPRYASRSTAASTRRHQGLPQAHRPPERCGEFRQVVSRAAIRGSAPRLQNFRRHLPRLVSHVTLGLLAARESRLEVWLRESALRPSLAESLHSTRHVQFATASGSNSTSTAGERLCRYDQRMDVSAPKAAPSGESRTSTSASRDEGGARCP